MDVEKIDVLIKLISSKKRDLESWENSKKFMDGVDIKLQVSGEEDGTIIRWAPSRLDEKEFNKFYPTMKGLIIRSLKEEIKALERGLRITINNGTPPVEPLNHSVYLRFFHGRKTEGVYAETGGIDGPIIGPVSFSWVYGQCRIYSVEGDTFFAFTKDKEGDFIQVDGIYYSDFKVLNSCDPVLDVYRKENVKFISFAQLMLNESLNP